MGSVREKHTFPGVPGFCYCSIAQLAPAAMGGGGVKVGGGALRPGRITLTYLHGC